MKHKTFLLLALSLSVSPTVVAQNVVVDSLEFDKAFSTTPAVMLEGRVAGLHVSENDGNVNGAVNATIRGINSLRSDSQPLWIIDGAIVNTSFNQNKDAFFQFQEQSYTSPLNALAFLNEYDIEKIEVVKDLSAAAIYGAKGANGVILVTTKMPKNEGLFVNVRSNVAVSTPSKANIDGVSTAVSHNHFISVSGLKNKTKFYLSGFFRKQNGIIRSNDSTYGGFRAGFDTKENSVVWFGMNAAVGIGKNNSIAGPSYFGQPSLTVNMRKDGFFPLDSREGWANDYDDNMDDRRTNASMYLTLNFLPTLSLKTEAGLDYSNNNRYIWYGNGTSFGLSQNGAASVLGTSMFKYNAKSVLSWNTFFAADHHLVISGGIEAVKDMNRFNTINGTDFFSHVLRARGISLSASKQINHKFDHDHFSWGLFGEASYTFKDFVGVNLTLRADNAPRYDDGRFILYKAATAFFDFHKALFSDSEVVSTLKLKAGYGEAGKEQYVPYGMYGQFLSGSYPTASSELEMFYEGFNRVRSSEFNASVELGFASDRLLLSAGIYNKRSTDSFNAYCFGKLGEDGLYWEPSARTDDFYRASGIANNGFEVSLDARIFDNRNFKWSLNANVAVNTNRMTFVNADDRFGSSVGMNIVANANLIGQPLGCIYGCKEDSGSASSQPCILGNTIPKFHGGIGTTFDIYGFKLDILGTAATGFKILDMNSMLFGEDDVFPDDKTYVVTDKYVKDGDYFRLSRVSLGYTFNFGRNSFLKSLEISASAGNLFVISKYDGWNVSPNCFSGSGLSRGIDYGSYPAPRSFMLGVSLNF